MKRLRLANNGAMRSIIARSFTSSASPASAYAAQRAAAENANANSRSPIQLRGIKHDGSTKRFFKSVGVTEYKTAGQPIQYAPTLSDRLIESTGGHLVCLPSRSLAAAVALEWQAQKDKIQPSSMPLMAIAINAIDLARPQRASYLKHFHSTILVDSALVRVSEPLALAKLQNKHLNPIVQFINKELGLSLQPTSALAAPPIGSAAHSRLSGWLLDQDEWRLAALDNVTVVTKSLLIAMALMAGRISVSEAVEASRVDENYQIKQYGRVDGIYGHGVDIEFNRLQLAASRTFVNLKENK